jgi:hypothetical protein
LPIDILPLDSYLVELKDTTQIPLVSSFVSKEYNADDEKAIWFHWVPLSEVKNLTVYPTKASELLPLLDEGVKHFVYRE